MRIVVAPDKFKGSLTAIEAARAIAKGARGACPEAEIETIPMADGGEGIVDALVEATSGTYHSERVTGPLGTPITARFGMLGDGQTAVVEMAAASGLVLLKSEERNPLRASTRGTGELILAAIQAGARRLIVGIGGSATNDGGAGLAQALGYQLLNARGEHLEPGGGSLDELDRIDPSQRDPLLEGVEISVACDVDNPLCGPTGASAVYGPQKGADRSMVERLDRNLEHFAKVIERDLSVSIRDLPGSGAAGGLGGGLVAFASGRIERGIHLVIKAVGLEARLLGADLCLTGEGALDASSAFGKTAVGVGRLARSLNCPTIALAGSLGDGVAKVLDEGIDAYFSICNTPMSLQDAMSNGAELLEAVAEQAVRGFLAGRRSPS